MSKPRVACQPIIFGRDYGLDKMLKAMADAGYDGVEIGPQRSPEGNEELRRLLGENGLVVAGSHMSYQGLDGIDGHLKFLKDFGGKLLMVSGVGDREKGAAAYADAAVGLNQAGRRAADEGIRLCYHNHSWEFQDTFSEGSGMDILLRELDPGRVRLCVDVYWVHDGKQDPAEFLLEWRDRVATVHLKDRKNDTFAEVGQGVLDFPAIFRVLGRMELPWVITEQDRTDKDPAVSIKMSRDYLRDVIGV